MDIRMNAAPPINAAVAPPTYAATAATDLKRALDGLPWEVARVEACEIINFLRNKYQIGGDAGGDSSTGQRISERSVNSPIRFSPIIKLMESDGNTDLSKGLNFLVESFNKELSDFEELIKSEDNDKIMKKAHGLTRIACYLNKERFNAYNRPCDFNEALLKYCRLFMSTSDLNQCSIVINRLFESTLQCCTTDATNNHGNNALTVFLDKLLTATTVEVDTDSIKEINRINNALKEGKPYLKYTANTVGRFCSSLLTKTLDVKVFRDSLDALFTLYEFTPCPEPLKKISTELNNIINQNAKRDETLTYGR